MENSRKLKSLIGQVQLLLKNNMDFPNKLKQRLVLESNNVKNPFQFIVGLLTEGVLKDGSIDPEAYFGFKEMIVQLAIMIACSKGADAIDGFMNSLEGSGNSHIISALRTWIKEDFSMETDGELSEPKEVVLAVDTMTSEKLAKNMRSTNEVSSSGTKLIDKIMSRVEDDFMEELEGHLTGKASGILNTQIFCSILMHENVLCEANIELTTGPDIKEVQQLETVIKAACSKKAIGSLILALQRSDNEHLLQDALEWLETSQPRKKNYPISVKGLASQPSKQERQAVRPTFFNQAAPLYELQKVATITFVPESFAKGTFAQELDSEKMMASFDDGRIKLGNWITNEEKIVKFGVQVKDITSFQYDEEIFVLGTSAGTVHLFDAITLEEQFSVRLGKPVQSLKFVESTLVTVTRDADGDCDSFWWIEICRSDMRLLNPMIMASGSSTTKKTFLVDPDYIYLYMPTTTVYVYSTRLGRRTMDDKNYSCWLEAPADMNTFNVVELISTIRYVVVGCKSGAISVWNTCRLVWKQRPTKTVHGHKAAVVTMCGLKGHLLSLDETGKLLLWSGYDLENKNMHQPVPRVLAENFCYGTDLVEHERWFASSSSDDGIVNVWTLPDLWLRTG